MVADILHIVKCARTRVLKKRICLSNSHYFFIQNIQCLPDGAYLTDLTPLSKLKDSYALEFFTFGHALTAFRKDNLNLGLYILPYALLLNAVRNPSISRRDRLYFLKSAFYIFFGFFHNLDEPRLSLIVETGKGPNKYFTFAQRNTLIRILNTILVHIYFIQNKQQLSLDRIGTHPTENYFGFIRTMCHSDHSIDKILSVVGRTVLVKKFLQKLGISPNIAKRDNLGGTIVKDLPEDRGFIDDPFKFSQCFMDHVVKLNEICKPDQEEPSDLQRVFSSYHFLSVDDDMVKFNTLHPYILDCVIEDLHALGINFQPDEFFDNEIALNTIISRYGPRPIRKKLYHENDSDFLIDIDSLLEEGIDPLVIHQMFRDYCQFRRYCSTLERFTSSYPSKISPTSIQSGVGIMNRLCFK